MLEQQTQQQQLQQVSALVERVISSIEQLRDDLTRYQEALPITNHEE